MLSGKLGKGWKMYLRRVTPEPFGTTFPKFDGQYEDGIGVKPRQYESKLEPVAIASFDRFGGGQTRQSDFEIYVPWKDIAIMIDKFCEAKHPEALAIHEAMKLAQAAKNLGWRPPEPASPQSN